MLHVQCLVCQKVLTVHENRSASLTECPECHHPFDLEQFTTLISGNPPTEESSSGDSVPSLDAIASPESSEHQVLPLREEDAKPTTPETMHQIADPRYVPLPYRPEGGVALGRFPLFFLQILFAGMLLGWLASRIGERVYLVLVFPLMIGMMLAGLVFVGNCWAKIRNPTLAGVVGALGGLMAMATMHYTDYQRSISRIERRSSSLPPRMITRLVQEPNLETYFLATAQEGLTITGSQDRGFNLGYAGTIIYWCAEVLIVMALAYFGGRHSAQEPFCGACQQWKQESTPGCLEGELSEVVPLFRSGHLDALVAYHPSPTHGSLSIRLTSCPRCCDREPIDVTLIQQKGQSEVPLLHLTYPGEALVTLERVFAIDGNSTTEEAA